MSTCPHGFDLECHLCPSYQDQLDEENYKRSLARMLEERALKDAIVEAAMAWVKHGEILPGLAGSPIANLFDACAALAEFRSRAKEGERGR